MPLSSLAQMMEKFPFSLNYKKEHMVQWFKWINKKETRMEEDYPNNCLGKEE